MTSSLTIVTPWYNHPEYADGYWEAIEAGAPDEVIIVDNGSDPPLPEWPDRRLRLQENVGFCGACNRGLEQATSEYVLFLNNDIELQRANWLQEIRAKLGPKRLVGSRVHGWWTEVDGVAYPYIDGWCIAAPREALLELGGWDETLTEPAYYSDNLLTFRAQEAGWEIVHVAPALRHLSNGTSRDNQDQLHHATRENWRRWQETVRESKLTTSTA